MSTAILLFLLLGPVIARDETSAGKTSPLVAHARLIR
jgi:hypothetical protein